MFTLKIASRRGPDHSSDQTSTYIKAGQGVRNGRHIDLTATRYPTSENVMYLYGPAGHLFPRRMQPKRILDRITGEEIGRAVVASHQKALVLHLEVQSKDFYIEMIRFPRLSA